MQYFWVGMGVNTKTFDEIKAQITGFGSTFKTVIDTTAELDTQRDES